MAKKIISLSMEPSTQEKLKVCSKKIGKSVSQLVEDLILENLDKVVAEDGPAKVSIDLTPQAQNLLDEGSKKSGQPVSKIVSDLVIKHLDLVIRNKENIPIILYIPSDLKGKQDHIRAWLEARTNGIVKNLG
jgi:predicted DNA-binding protein